MRRRIPTMMSFIFMFCRCVGRWAIGRQVGRRRKSAEAVRTGAGRQDSDLYPNEGNRVYY